MSRAAPARTSWTIEPGCLMLGWLVRISFQRYPRPVSELLDVPPRSWGALPVAAADDRLILPLAEDEAFWLGLSTVRSEVVVALRVVVSRQTDIDAVTGEPWSAELREEPRNYVQVLPVRSLDGIRRLNRIAPFVRYHESGNTKEHNY